MDLREQFINSIFRYILNNKVNVLCENNFGFKTIYHKTVTYIIVDMNNQIMYEINRYIYF